MSESRTPSLQKFDPQLLIRLKSALIMGFLVLGCVFAGSVYFIAFVMFLAWMSVREWNKMVEPDAPNVALNVFQILAVSVILGSTVLKLPSQALILALGSGFLITTISIFLKCQHPFRMGFGFVYVAYALSTLLWLRLYQDIGIYLLLMVLLMIWASDSLAYFIGKYVGGPKLAPKISPKKTWSGLFGSCLGASLLLVGMSSSTILQLFNIENALAPWFIMVIFGCVMGVLGQVGDLIISQVKRHYNLKDTGTLIPGHGGILDRIDALIFVTPLFAAFVWVLLL